MAIDLSYYKTDRLWGWTDNPATVLCCGKCNMLLPADHNKDNQSYHLESCPIRAILKEAGR